MMQLTAKYIADISGVSVSSNLTSVYQGLFSMGFNAGLLKPHRLVQYLAQLMHESMDYRYDREIWGPTAAQSRYEGREDLGNIFSGDGSKFRGYTPMQITGRYNTTDFYKWCLGLGLDIEVPDFTQTPSLMNTDPWEGIGPIWYWESRNLNRYADTGDVEMISKLINGGTNGLADRLENYTEVGLRVLGYGAGDVRQFQGAAGLVADGISGPKTRAALHSKLSALPEYSLEVDPTPEPSAPIPASEPETPHGAVLALAQIRRVLNDYDANV